MSWMPKGSIPYQEPQKQDWTNSGLTGWLINQAPNIGGVIGGTAGAIGSGVADVGTEGAAIPLVNPVTGGVAGSAAGGAIGSAVKDLLQGKAQNNPLGTVADVGLGAAQQAPYGLLGIGDVAAGPVERALANTAVPGLTKAALGFGTKALGRGVGGYGAGYLNALFSGKSPQEAQKEAISNRNLNVVAGQAGDILHGMGKFFLTDIPKDVQSRLVDLPAQAEKATKLNLALKDAGQLVGDQNYQYALNEGIIPAEKAGEKLVPNTVHTMENTVDYVGSALDKTASKAQQVENMLQQKLIGAPPVAQADADSLRTTLLTQFDTLEGQLNPTLQKKLSTMVRGANLDTLSKINDLKRSIGTYFGKSNTARAMYSELKNFIEKTSGSDAVKGLNQEAYRLMQIRSNINDIMEKGAPRTQADVENLINRAKGVASTSGPSGATTTGLGSWARNLPPSLQKFNVGAGGLAAVLAPLGVRLATGGLTSGLGLGSAAVGGLGAYFIARQAMQHLAETPAGQQWLAQMITRGERPASAMGQALLQLINRVPQNQ